MHDSSSMCSPTTMRGEAIYHPRPSTTIEGSEHNPETPRAMTVPKELQYSGTLHYLILHERQRAHYFM